MQGHPPNASKTGRAFDDHQHIPVKYAMSKAGTGLAELTLLVDAAQSSRFLTEHTAASLTCRCRCTSCSRTATAALSTGSTPARTLCASASTACPRPFFGTATTKPALPSDTRDLRQAQGNRERRPHDSRRRMLRARAGRSSRTVTCAS